MNWQTKIVQYCETPLLRRLFVSAIWNVGGVGLARFLVIASNIPIARMLGIENYGQLIIIQSTLAMAGVFAGLGLGLTAIKYTAELKERNPVRLGNILGMVRRVALIGGGLIVVALIFASSFIATYVINLPHLAKLLAIASISVVFLTLDGYQNSALLGFGAVKHSVVAILIPALLSIPVTIALVYLYALEGAVVGMVLLSIIQYIFSHRMLGKVLKSYHVKLENQSGMEWKVLRDFALPALLSGAMVAPVHWICHVLLINSSDGQAQMAVLGIAGQWFQILYFIPLAVGRITLPVITEAVIQNDVMRTRNIFKGAMLANAAIVLPVALLVFVLSHWIMRMYGVVQTDAWLALSLMVAAASVVSICAPAGLVFVAKGELWYSWMLNFAWAITYVIASYCLLGYGAVGVASGLLVAYIFHAIWSFMRVRFEFNANKLPTKHSDINNAA